MLGRDEAFKITRMVDDAGFSCTLSVRADGDHRRYEVTASLDGLDGDDLNRLLGAMHLTGANVKVDRGYLVAS